MTGPFHPTGHARVNPNSPQAIGVCQRCGFWFQRAELSPQYEYEGVKLQNLELYVCRKCYDTPQAQLKTIVIPADPLPVYRPFPEDFISDDMGGSPLGFDPGTLRPNGAVPHPSVPAVPQTPTMTMQPQAQARPNPRAARAARAARAGVSLRPFEMPDAEALPDPAAMVATEPARPNARVIRSRR